MVLHLLLKAGLHVGEGRNEIFFQRLVLEGLFCLFVVLTEQKAFTTNGSVFSFMDVLVGQLLLDKLVDPLVSRLTVCINPGANCFVHLLYLFVDEVVDHLGRFDFVHFVFHPSLSLFHQLEG